jgi:CheY-like chemotaxis protein
MSENYPILLVEDAEDDVFIMKRALKAAGITNPLQVVGDGDAAVEYFRGSGKFGDRQSYPLPSIVFLDLKLPLRSGHEVLTWVRERAEFSSIVIVVLTSSEEPEDLRKAYQLGANSYLVKPPTSEQLVEVAKAFKWYWLDYNEFVPVK